MNHPHLLSPGRIGTLALRNRILMCPMGDNQATSGGYVTDQQIAYFEARAKGGAALLLVGSVGVTAPEGLASPRQSAIGDDSFLEGWSRLAERVHAHGAKLALQLVHNGKNAVEDIIAARPLLVPSVLAKSPPPDPLMGMLTEEEAANMGTPSQVEGARVILHEMTREDIADMARAYAEAVERARRAGVDGVELHAGHGYLIDNFLSPTTNHREDEYGGPVENRARFLVEILRAIRERVGDEFPVWCRINGEEFLTEGETLEDGCRVAELAEQAGADALHVSAYADPSRAIGFSEAHATHTPGRFLELGAAVRKRVGIPVITVGRLEPDAAERALAEGKADFVAMGRKLLADPELPNKLAAGAAETIRPCMYHYRCISQIFVRSNVRCAANAFTGFESTRRIEPAERSRSVLVVGGGPAGMEAARVASLRGHRVVLAEAGPRLGGRFRLGAATAETNAALLGWMEAEVARAEIELRLDTRLTPEAIVSQGFDEVVFATGARWPMPVVPVEEGANVLTADGLLGWLEREEEPNADRDRRVVVVGGNRPGLGVAEVARRRGARVVVLEAGTVFASSNGMIGRWRLVHEAQERGIELLPETTLRAVESDRVHAIGAGGEELEIPADRVLVTSGAQPDTGLAEATAALGASVHSIGDCADVRFVEGAMESAVEVALAL